MPVDLGLKLLELTGSRPALSLNDLGSLNQVDSAQLARLTEKGFVRISDGALIMDNRQRVTLAEQLIHNGIDPKRVSRFLVWQEFEEFAEHLLRENRFTTHRHLIFTSLKGRREIDIFAWSDTLMLAVDCKHWLRGWARKRIGDAAKAQVERVNALAGKPQLLYRLKVPHPEGRSIIPVILALGDAREKMIDGVPIVSVSKLMSFIYGVSPIDGALARIQVATPRSQSCLA